MIELLDVLAEEINVKQIKVVAEVGALVAYKLLPNNRVPGPRLGKLFHWCAAPWLRSRSGGSRRPCKMAAPSPLTWAAFPSAWPAMTSWCRPNHGGLAVASDKGVTVAVDTHLTAELVAEGLRAICASHQHPAQGGRLRD
ncbi:hypothetical protein [Candidatus Amarobacter glycogenicus]|uniref:hypothetical protein n=1 Tax=Candidatus Amarobacter glycogenicus TaxID=3140699 RepID=UPI003135C41B|nr:hypothetical protein [Dehalococcoidia bacterium]